MVDHKKEVVRHSYAKDSLLREANALRLSNSLHRVGELLKAADSHAIAIVYHESKLPKKEGDVG